MLNVYNTLTRQKEEFTTITPGKVRMYVCGVTVYDYCHLGHARAYVTSDMVYRYLKFSGYDVTFVRNFTDIDDKIINRANEQKVDFRVITETFIKAFHEDMNALRLKPATIEPKATEHIPEMIALIQNLEKQGIAYAVNGDVFYSVRSFKEYGKLSGKNIEDLESGARVDVLESKRDPLDFALWKSAKPGEPEWDSPWGKGRPGWHIECSAMSMKHLSETFDIHGGGRDLIFPHHENEIAQSEGCTHKPFARYWIHNGFVNINAEKMSKSLNNFHKIRDLLNVYPAEVLKLFILSAHYRSPLDYTEQNITQAQTGMERYYQTKLRLKEAESSASPTAESEPALVEFVNGLPDQLRSAMDDDFNSAKVVGLVFESIREFNRVLDDKKPLNSKLLADYNAFLKSVDDVLGLFGSDPELYLNEMKSKALGSSIAPEEIEALIVERKAVRAAKDWKRSDQIRDELAAKGVVLKDNPDGTTTWTVK